MTASVNEWQREIGIFRAIGFRRTHIMKVIFTETAILNFLSGIIIYSFGIGISMFFNFVDINLSSTGISDLSPFVGLTLPWNISLVSD